MDEPSACVQLTESTVEGGGQVKVLLFDGVDSVASSVPVLDFGQDIAVLKAGCLNQLLSQVLLSVGNFLVRIAKASMYSLRHLSFGLASSSSFLSPIKDTFALDSWV